MNCVFVSNYLTHHQIPFCEAMYKKTAGNFYFIAQERMSAERVALNWEVPKAPYEIRTYESEENYELAKKLLREADVAIISGNSNRFLDIQQRLRSEKLTFRFSERLFKKEHGGIKNLVRTVKHYLKNAGYKNLYLLCASAYTATDYARFKMFLGKAFQWGYFPENKKYDNISELIEKKEEASLLWAGRFIDWKHPEIPVLVAEKLRDAGYSFKINMIGAGAREEEIARLIQEKDLSDFVTLLGGKTPQEVREQMERSKVFLFTSDRGEGWGAVLNEAMNSGCACIASHAIGSAPCLIEDKENGFLYKDGDIDDLFNKVKYLLDNRDACKKMGEAAYLTVTNQWCAETAADRFVQLAEKLLDGETDLRLFDSGVLSIAKKLDNNWYA